MTRLGVVRTRTILFEASAQRLFEPKDARIRKIVGMLWLRCRAVAKIAQDVARKAGVVSADEAYLAGLLHDVGKPIVAAMLVDAEHSMGLGEFEYNWPQPDIWLSIVNRSHQVVGLALATKWALPAFVHQSIQWAEAYREDTCGVADVVCFSNALAKVSGFEIGVPNDTKNRRLCEEGARRIGIDADALVEAVPHTVGDEERMAFRLDLAA